jgi:hypothetical protein
VRCEKTLAITTVSTCDDPERAGTGLSVGRLFS